MSMPFAPSRRWRAAGLAAAGLALLGTANVAATFDASADDAGLRARVAKSPLDRVALRTLAERAEARGDGAQATKLAGLAGALGWRDGPTQLLLLRQSVAREDAAGVLLRLDAILRRRPQLGPTMLPLLHAAAHDPIGRRALAARLSENPPWRAPFFQQMTLLPIADVDSHAALLGDLARVGRLDRDQELAPFVWALAARGEDERARSLWVERAAGPIVDPGFTSIPDDVVAPPGAPFVWVARRVAGVQLQSAFGGGLTVSAEPSAFGTLLEQRVVLAPGRYRLRMRVSSADPLRRGTLRWIVGCTTGPALLQAAGSEMEHHWDVQFEIPQGCPAQRISLEARRSDGLSSMEMQFGPMTIAQGQGVPGA